MGSIPRSNKLLRKPTRSESVLWKHLSAGQIGTTFTQQFPLFGEILSFYSEEWGLAIEIDGNGSSPAANSERDDKLESYGIRTLRFRESDSVAAIICDILADRSYQVRQLERQKQCSQQLALNSCRNEMRKVYA